MSAHLYEIEIAETKARDMLQYAIEAEHDAELDLEAAHQKLEQAREKRRRRWRELTDTLDAIGSDARASVTG